jgi:hypothetical protein
MPVIVEVCTRQVGLPSTHRGLSYVRRSASPEIAVIDYAVLARVAFQASQIHQSIIPSSRRLSMWT